MSDPVTQQAIEAANRLQAAGRVGEAEQLYRQVLARQPEDVTALQMLGALAGRAGRNDEAIELLERCVSIDPNNAAAHSTLGAALQASDRPAEAIAHFQRAVELEPNSAQLHYNLGKAQRDQQQLEAAAGSFRQALALQPALPPAWNNLGNTLRDLGRVEEAVPCYERALQLRPNHPPTLHNLGLVLRGLMRLDEAMRCFDTALAFDPAHNECRVSRAMVLLMRGEFERGWREYESRWEITRAFTRKPYPQPLWDGLDPRGRTILLHAEQGFGDAIQFVRYAPLVADRGARVIVECPPPLKRLFQSLRGVDEVVTAGDDVPEFDLHCPLMSLPLIFGTTVETIPADVPYLSAEPAQVERWRQIIPSGGRRVGVVWAGAAGYLADRNRSLPLAQLAPLADAPVQFVSLQKGPAATEASAAPPGMKLVDVSGRLDDFADTAAAIESLDLVISVDTAVGHLAGAMGKPVWLLVPFSPDWRWLLDRPDTPWYPAMRLFRQRALHDWDTVIRSVREALLGL